MGGSSIKLGIVEKEEITKFARIAYNSNDKFLTIIQFLASLIDKNTQFLALSFPGPCDYANGIVLVNKQEKLQDFYKKNILTALSHACKLPIHNIRMRNDAESAIIAEARYGIYASEKRILGITLGTGFGSAIIEKGNPIHIPHRYAKDGSLYTIPFNKQKADSIFSTRGILALASSMGISGKNVYTLAIHARSKQQQAVRVFQEFGAQLGIFLSKQLDKINPAYIIVQGGISYTFSLFSHSLTSKLRIPVYQGSFGEKAALLGAANLFSVEK